MSARLEEGRSGDKIDNPGSAIVRIDWGDEASCRRMKFCLPKAVAAVRVCRAGFQPAGSRGIVPRVSFGRHKMPPEPADKMSALHRHPMSGFVPDELLAMLSGTAELQKAFV